MSTARPTAKSAVAKGKVKNAIPGRDITVYPLQSPANPNHLAYMARLAEKEAKEKNATPKSGVFPLESTSTQVGLANLPVNSKASKSKQSTVKEVAVRLTIDDRAMNGAIKFNICIPGNLLRLHIKTPRNMGLDSKLNTILKFIASFDAQVQAQDLGKVIFIKIDARFVEVYVTLNFLCDLDSPSAAIFCALGILKEQLSHPLPTPLKARSINAMWAYGEDHVEHLYLRADVDGDDDGIFLMQ